GVWVWAPAADPAGRGRAADSEQIRTRSLAASMHIGGSSYDEIMRSFRWEVPQRFNIADAICEGHARRTPAAPALIYEQADGSVRHWSFGEISAAANRCANVLAQCGVERGVVVGIHLAQGPETLIAHVAIQ